MTQAESLELIIQSTITFVYTALTELIRQVLDHASSSTAKLNTTEDQKEIMNLFAKLD